MASKRTPEINASRQADIAFLLLVFFLVTTTMDIDKGIHRRLPPMPEENQKTEIKINRRNTIIVRISSSNKIFVGTEQVDVSQIKDKIVDFLDNPNDDPNKPEKEVKNIEGFRPYPVSKGVVSLQNDKGTLYATYIEVQNEIVRAVNELRDRFALQNFGRKFTQLDDVKQKIVKDAVPQNISEAEPKDVKGKK